MKVSVNWIRFINQKYGCAGEPAPDGVEKLVEKIGAQLGAVDEVIDLGKKYEGVVVAKVISCEKHPDADKLTVCMVDDGGVVEGVERNASGHVQIVCGAANVVPTLAVAWIPPGVVVPSTHHKDPFKLEDRDIRGVKSNGMIASAKELDLGDEHEGILIIDKPTEPGQPFAKVYELDDYIINIENKMFTHRPDLFGILGVAREIAGIQNQTFKSPDWYKLSASPPKPEGENLKLEIKNELPKLVPRFTAVAIRGVTVQQSPSWLQSKLIRAGVKPINNIVDITNFYMLETAQPLHAYDYDKVVTDGMATLVVRDPKDGEKLKLLGGKEITLKNGSIVIATPEKAIGLGGVMGGADTDVDGTTKNIILEAANFDMNTTRATARQYGLFTDAALRFTKGQSPLQTVTVLAKATDDIKKLSGGSVASESIDNNHVPQEVLQLGTIFQPLELEADFINSRLGLKLTTEEISSLLKNVEFDVSVEGERLSISAPFWRTDIEIPEDIVEEVGRLHGYDHLPLELPKRDLKPARPEERITFKNQLRGILSSAGANEILTYSFVNDWLLDTVSQEKTQAYKIRNALSPDLQYYRLSLTPSLLEKVHPNAKAGIKKFAIYELGKSHNKMHNEEDEKNLPRQFNTLSLVLTGGDKKSGAAFYGAKAYSDFLASKLGLQFDYLPFKEAADYPVVKPYDLNRSAIVLVRGTKIMAGMVGEFRPAVLNGLKIPRQTAGFELSVDELMAATRNKKPYRPLSKFPKVEQDISLKVPASISYREVFELASRQLDELKTKNSVAGFEPLDIYQEESNQYKHITLRLNISSHERTLVAEEVNELLDKIATKAGEQFDAQRL